MKELKGKVALVTGSSRGIGRAIALALAEEGADIAVCCVKNVEAAQCVVEQVTRLNVRSKWYKFDIADSDAVEKNVSQVANDLGPPAVLVNNAGITRDKSFVKMNRMMWDEVININLSGVFNVTHAVVPIMLGEGWNLSSWGRIINISSIVGQWGNYGQANYAAAKGGILAFTMTLARELARKDITVNSVCPGFTETDLTRDLPDGVKMQVAALTPMGRMGKPEEIAAAVAFLASPRASFITGQAIAVNGGMYM